MSEITEGLAILSTIALAITGIVQTRRIARLERRISQLGSTVGELYSDRRTEFVRVRDWFERWKEQGK